MKDSANRPILSIGIPLYNMEKLLGDCLDSLLPKRVASEPGWVQVVVVNDGSTDGSLELARSYERRFPGSVEVVDKENGGHGSCINAAVARAKGKYFKLVDSDDWLDPTELLRHLHHLESCDADLVVCDYRQVHEDGRRNEVSWKGRLKAGVRPSETVWKELSRNRDPLGYLHMHALTWRTELLRDVRITEHSFYVDQEYAAFPMRLCRTVDYEPICLYQYRLGRQGQSMDNAVLRKRSSPSGCAFAGYTIPCPRKRRASGSISKSFSTTRAESISGIPIRRRVSTKCSRGGAPWGGRPPIPSCGF